MLIYIFCSGALIRKVTPEDVGGEEILNNIKSDIMEMFENTVSMNMNQMCYCKTPLKRSFFKRPFNDWWCLSCFSKQSGRVSFDCNNDQCVFKRLSGWSYYVCPTCFEWTDINDNSDETEKREDGKETTYIHRQINHSINMISSDFLYFRV